MSLIADAGTATPDTAAKAAPAATPDAAATPQASGDSQPAVVTPTGDWYYDHNIKADGTKPDWFKGDKYKTVTDQAKAYAEVEKKLGAFKGAPEKYDLTIADHPELKFSEEDPLLKDFLENAKKNGVSQEYVSELLGVYAQALTFNLPDADAEMKKIGVNAEQDLQILSQWAGNILAPEEFNIFKSMITTADAFKVFDKLRNAGTGADINPAVPNASHETSQQVLALINDPRYESDPDFRADMRKRLSQAMAREGGKK
jgi:hypothetical protein